jgi:phenylacetate-CoA ligase
MSNIVRLYAPSGTMGRTTVVGNTKRDIYNWAELIARCLIAAGVSKNDIIHNNHGYGLFTGVLEIHYGTEKLGASLIPI